MDAIDTNTTMFSFNHASLRHLAWVCQAPQLIDSPISFDPQQYLPADYLQTLQKWDQHPDHAPELLMLTPQRRLGFYFERLYEVLLNDLLGWDILLKNQQIQSNGQTLGELDFVVHNRADDRIEHHEIAIKYYLGVPQSQEKTKWYGPNARDRLDLKSDRLLNHQSRRTHQPETLALLADHGITGPLTACIFMPGYLFYLEQEKLTPPGSAPSNHLRGYWAYSDEATKLDHSHWVQLHKPHWIGPWRQTEEPSADLASAALMSIEHDRVPRLFAELRYHKAADEWREVHRLFVMPLSWLD